MNTSFNHSDRNAIRRTGPRLQWCALLGGIALALTSSAVADVPIRARFADTVPLIDGNATTADWNFSTATTLRVGEIVMRTKNDADYLYLLLDVQSDTSGDTPSYVLTFDVNQDYAVTYFRDFSYALGIGPIGSPPPLFVKWFAEPPPVGPSVPMPSPVDPRSRAAFGFGLSELEPSWPSHRICEFRLSLAELGLTPADLRSPTARVPFLRMRVGYAGLDKPFDPINEPSLGGPTGYDDMFVILLSGAPAFPPDLVGPIFQGVGLVPAGGINSIHGTTFFNLTNWPYQPPLDAPFGGSLQIKVRFALTLANRYRILYAKAGEPFRALRQSWVNLHLPDETPVAFAPDADGSYPIMPDMASANAWYLPNLAILWNSGQFEDGLYHLKFEATNTLTRSDHTVSGPDNNLTLRIVNTPPQARIDSIRYNGADVCECGFVTQGDAPRGFTFTISAVDTNGALDSVSFNGTWGNGRAITDLRYSDSYRLDRDGARVWYGASNIVLRASDPWRAHRSCAFTFNLSAHSRSQNGFGTLYSAGAVSSLTIIAGRGAGRTDCPPASSGGLPSLSVRDVGGRVAVTWPVEFPEFRLQSAKDPGDTSSWEDWADPVVIVGEDFAAFPPSKPREFFRLMEQP